MPSNGITMSSDEDDEDEDDSDSDEEQLNADGSVILTGRKGRVSLLHETQMTQRRTSKGHQALREAAERQAELNRVSREVEQSDGIISSLLNYYLMHKSLSCWRILTDRQQKQKFEERLLKSHVREIEQSDKTISSLLSCDLMHKSLSCWRNLAGRSQRRRLIEASQSDDILDDIIASDSAVKLMLRGLLSWRRLTDTSQKKKLQESMEKFRTHSETTYTSAKEVLARTEADAAAAVDAAEERMVDVEQQAAAAVEEAKSKAKAKIARAERRIAEVEKGAERAKAEAEEAAAKAQATIASLEEGLHRSQTIKMQVGCRVLTLLGLKVL
jgi:hypothetical protein